MLDTIRYLASETWLDLVSNNDEELHVSKKISVTLQWKSENLIDIYRKPKILPDKSGIYIIYNGKEAHYVGISERNLRVRFRSRWRVFREFDINRPEIAKLLNNKKMVWATIKIKEGPNKGVVRQGKKNFKGSGRSLKSEGGVLKVIELHLVNALGTHGSGKGNIRIENVIYKSGGKITVNHEPLQTHGKIGEIQKKLKLSINSDIRR